MHTNRQKIQDASCLYRDFREGVSVSWTYLHHRALTKHLKWNGTSIQVIVVIFLYRAPKNQSLRAEIEQVLENPGLYQILYSDQGWHY